MHIDEKLLNYKNSIEKALAGFMTNKKTEELDDNDVEEAKRIVSEIPMDKYFALADALDRDDDEAVADLTAIARPPMGDHIMPTAESEYVDRDLLVREGFSYFGVFEDEKLRERVAKYLDENEVEYMDGGDGHMQMKFADREHAYRAEAAIARIVARSNPRYVRDDIEMEARKPFPDPGKKHRRFNKPKGLTGGSHHLRKLQKKNGGQGCFTEEEQEVEEAKKGTKTYGKGGKPMYVRSGGPTKPQSGAGAHATSTKKGKLAKADPLTGKHKKDLKNLEESEMINKKKIEEGVMGMADIPSLNRMRKLAGMPPLKEDEVKNMSKEELDEALPVPMDDSPMMIEPVDEVPSDELPGDEGGEEFVGPMGDEVPDGAVDAVPDMGDDMAPDMGDDMAPDMGAPVTDVAPPMGDPMGGMGDVRSEIEGSIDTMLTKAPELKIADYKEVLSKAEDAVAQMRAMGSQYLKEGKKNESLREWANKQTGFKKTFINEQMQKRSK